MAEPGIVRVKVQEINHQSSDCVSFDLKPISLEKERKLLWLLLFQLYPWCVPVGERVEVVVVVSRVSIGKGVEVVGHYGFVHNHLFEHLTVNMKEGATVSHLI